MIAETNLDFLIEDLRIHLGDYTSPYRYTDEMLMTTLVAAVKNLQRWWSRKYLINSDNDAERNPAWEAYAEADPPIIQTHDQRPIVLMASIIIKGGSLENSSWNLGHWKDAEISYSNVAGGKNKKDSYMADKAELEGILTPPSKKLKKSLKGSLPGFKNNDYETQRQ